VHTTWRATAAYLLLASGALVSLLTALGLSSDRVPVPTPAVTWLGVSLLAAGGFASWLHARETRRLRRYLTTGLTHHFRTSLAHIQAYNEMLLLGSDMTEEQRQGWLEIVGREAERLSGAVENVLMILRDRRGDAYPVRRPVDLGALLEDAATDCAAAGCAEARLESGPQGSILVNADPAALKHALQNLIQSLARFCAPGQALSARLIADGSTATVQVALGSAALTRQHRLGRNPFREEDLEGETANGFGLEIAVVQHVARAHGGRATSFHNASHSGYRVELPRHRP
jgi:two-component system, OmpR family, phosphate regulon sensor histidine kinase PhoR